MAPGEKTASPTEMEALELVVDRLRESEQTARQNCQLLMEVIDLLPIGVTLQDRKGEVLLANAAAAPAGLSAPAGESEQRIVGPAGEHSVQVARRAVRVAGQDLVLTTACDVTERRRVEAELGRQAYLDELTGLPNRLRMQQQIGALLDRSGRHCFAMAGIHQRPRSQTVLRTIEAMSLGLGMSMVAEGVESFEELAYLQAATRIHFGQGYYFAKPFFLDEVGRHHHSESRPAPETREQSDERRFHSGRLLRRPSQRMR